MEKYNPRYIDFPQAESACSDAKVIQADPENRIMLKYPPIRYDNVNGRDLHIELVIPERHEDYIPKYMPDGSFYDIPLPTNADGSRACAFPLLIYVQGSGWLTQNLGFRIPLHSRIVKQGYAMAFVEYQSVEEAPFPAQLDNVRSAISYLKNHAEEYNLDMNRVVLSGDSSGGHIAVMLGIQEAVLPVSVCDFRGIIDFYGPAVIEKLDFELAKTLLQTDSEADFIEKARAVSPVTHIRPDVSYPPFLILHGDRDRLVDYSQSEMLYEKLKSCGAQADFYRVHGGDHGRGEFWCDAVFDVILQFLKKWT